MDMVARRTIGDSTARVKGHAPLTYPVLTHHIKNSTVPSLQNWDRWTRHDALARIWHHSWIITGLEVNDWTWPIIPLVALDQKLRRKKLKILKVWWFTGNIEGLARHISVTRFPFEATVILKQKGKILTMIMEKHLSMNAVKRRILRKSLIRWYGLELPSAEVKLLSMVTKLDHSK